MTFARPGWHWAVTDTNHLQRQRRQLEADERCQEILQCWRVERRPRSSELALMERVNASRCAALQVGAMPVGVLWCRDDRTRGVRLYQLLLQGGLVVDAAWETREEARERVRLACWGDDDEVDRAHIVLDEWCSAADEQRWEPCDFNHYLERRLGDEGAAALRVLASSGGVPTCASTEAKAQYVDLLIAYARHKGQRDGDISNALPEDRAWQASLMLDCGGDVQAFTVNVKRSLASARSAAERRAVVVLHPRPVDELGKPITDASAQCEVDCIDWSDGGGLWRDWLAPLGLRRLDSYARPPEALGSALLRVFIRSRETEDSAVGMCIEDAAGGDAFRVCVTAEQVALMLPDVNRGFIGELLKLQVSRRIAGRGLFLLVAATDGAHAKAVERSSLTALQGGADPVSLLPRVGCGAYFGQQLLASACPLGVGRSLPPWYDNNLAELYGLILAQRQHLALLVGISVGQVARRLAHDCEFGIGVADDAGVAARPLYEGVGLRSLDLLVSIDSEMIAKLVDRAWEQNDLGRLRGETYGLRLEESLLMRRWAKRCGAELVLLRLSSHVGFVHNEMADAIATVASARYGVCEPPLIVRRTLAFITCVGGLASPWHAGATGERSGAEFDGKTSLRVRVYSHGVYLRRLIAEQVKVYTATRGTGDDYVAGLAEATGLRLHERFSRGEELCSLRELLVREVIIHVDGTACAELIEGRHFASPIYDYEFAGRDVTNGHRRYDRRIQKALATQRMGGAGNSTQLSRVGMRQIFRNFEQVVLPGLGSSAQRDADQPAWDALPRRTCPACGRKARCDVFHFFECDNGLTDDVSVAVARALSAQALLLHPAGADAEMGDSDTHVELAWAQAAVLCRRQNGELGRYRRFLAAKVFGGAFAPPAHDSIEATAREWAINVPPADVDEAERLSDEEDEEGSVSAERSRLAKFKRRVLRYYVHKVVALNTMIIDHLRGPYGVWLRTMLEGDAGLKRLFGGDHELVAGVDDARLCEEHLDGVFRSRGDEQERLMTRAEFVHERDEGLLPPGEFTQTIAGETLKLSVAAEGDAAARRARREARKVQQLEVVEQGKFKYARPECERELGIILERRIKLGYRNLDVPTAEEAAILRDGGRARALELMTAASEIGRCAWYDGDGGGDGGDGGDMARESEGWLGGRSRPHHHELGSHVVMAGEAPPVLEREAEPRGVTPPPCQYAEEGERGGERGETVVERSVAESGDGVVDRGGVHDDGYGDADMDMSMDMGFDESVGESMAEASGWGPEAVAEGRDLGMVAEDGVSAAGIGMGGTADGVLEGIPARSMGVFAGSSSAAAASEAGGGDAAAASEVAAAGGVTGVKRACGVVSGGEAGERGEERKRKKKKAPGAGRVGRQVGMTRSRRDAVKRASSAPPRADGGQS